MAIYLSVQFASLNVFAIQDLCQKSQNVYPQLNYGYARMYFVQNLRMLVVHAGTNTCANAQILSATLM